MMPTALIIFVLIFAGWMFQLWYSHRRGSIQATHELRLWLNGKPLPYDRSIHTNGPASERRHEGDLSDVHHGAL